VGPRCAHGPCWASSLLPLSKLQPCHDEVLLTGHTSLPSNHPGDVASQPTDWADLMRPSVLNERACCSITALSTQSLCHFPLGLWHGYL
jgi:hypothetical protein